MKSKSFLSLVLVLSLFVGMSFVQSLAFVAATDTQAEFNVPVYIQTRVGIERASSDEIIDYIFNHNFEVEKRTEEIPMKDCSLRATGGSAIIDGVELGANNKLSFNLNYLVSGDGSLTSQKWFKRFSLSFEPKKIIKTDDEKLAFRGVGSGNLNREKINFDKVEVIFDKINNKVNVIGSGDKTLTVSGMSVSSIEGCLTETRDFYLIKSKNVLDKTRTIGEARKILDQHPEFIDAYENINHLYLKNWQSIVPAHEICNGIDDNNNGEIDEEDAIGCVAHYYDGDADNYGISDSRCLCKPEEGYNALVDGDCNDNNALINPGMQESCNGIDDNCNLEIDEEDALGCVNYYYDNDKDNYGIDDYKCLCAIKDLYTAPVNGDCDDTNANVNPSVQESCNNIDDNCDGFIDEENALGCLGYFSDTDADGFGIGESRCLCKADGTYTTLVDGDCDDTRNNVYPGATEVCDILDNDCNAETQDGSGVPTPSNTKQDGVCAGSLQICSEGTWIDSYIGVQNYEEIETTCDGKDNDCDASADEELTAPLADNQNGICENSLKVCSGELGWTEPDYTQIANYETAESSCDNLDNDCNGIIDTLEKSCGADSCLGTSICMIGEWGDCSTSGNDAGMCAICDKDGKIVFDAAGTEQGDCNAYNLPILSQCDYTPDGNSYTLDTNDAVYSSCQDVNLCSTVAYEEISHECDKETCGAECEISEDCQPKCVGDIYYSAGNCNNGCSCEYQTNDCNLQDGWYDTGNKQLVNTDECNEKEQEEQEYRDYSCGNGCEYIIAETQWVDTGVTSYELDGTTCNDLLYCTVNDGCNSGVCAGVPGDISDSVACTVDVCNEELDALEHNPDNSACDDNLYCNGVETCSLVNGCEAGVSVDCSANNLNEISTCENNPDNNPFTFDYRAAFSSVCNEEDDSCTLMEDLTIISICDKTLCSAECVSNEDCAATECDNLDGCYEGTYRDYSDVANTCNECQCTDNVCETSYINVTTDNDGDGYDIQCENDCDDSDNTIYPGNEDLAKNCVNDAPVLAEIQDIDVTQGDLITITAIATDVDTLVLTYMNDNLNFIQNGNVFTWQTTNETVLGTYVANISVDDGELSDSQLVSILVNQVEQPQ
ncbi:MAG: putative metal-binding motif-containing protein [Candidatus Nanoarchaeia archaeon]|nr:putative metal-binding motif-containing protein [Candidatus Nanoarchaeia archaeon]